MSFVVAPSRKPAFWALVEAAKRAEGRAAKVKEPEPVKNAKPPAKKAAKAKKRGDRK